MTSLYCEKCKQRYIRKGYYETCKCGRVKIKKGVVTPVKPHTNTEIFASADEYEALV